MCVHVCANLFLTQCKEKVTSSLFFLQRKENWGSVCSGGGGATPRTFGGEGQDGAEKKNTITETRHQWGKKKHLQTSNIPFFSLLVFT